MKRVQALLKYNWDLCFCGWHHGPSQDRLLGPFGDRSYDPGNKALTPAGHCFSPRVPLWFSALSDLLSQYILMMLKNINYAEK